LIRELEKMIIPIRCFTCNHVLADKWDYYVKECEKENGKTRAQVLDELGLKRMCCRRHFLGHVDMMDRI
jgi:DNA-directed RNA polymerase subunit N (RpoN/RPB10)